MLTGCVFMTRAKNLYTLSTCLLSFVGVSKGLYGCHMVTQTASFLNHINILRYSVSMPLLILIYLFQFISCLITLHPMLVENRRIRFVCYMVLFLVTCTESFIHNICDDHDNKLCSVFISLCALHNAVNSLTMRHLRIAEGILSNSTADGISFYMRDLSRRYKLSSIVTVLIVGILFRSHTWIVGMFSHNATMQWISIYKCYRNMAFISLLAGLGSEDRRSHID